MSSHAHAKTICSGSAVSGAVSALHFLRSYSLFTPNSDVCRYEPYSSKDYNFGNIDILESSNISDTAIGRTPSPLTPSSLSAFSLPGSLLQPPFVTTMPPLMQSISVPPAFSNSNAIVTFWVRIVLQACIDDQEAKKNRSLTIRKMKNIMKGVNIALRATMLEHENAILRAQVITLREEAQCLRHMLIKQQASSLHSIDRSISSMTPVTLSPSHTTATLDCQI
ncbi:unnamed protein product, partial [Heterotrigona itama]